MAESTCPKCDGTSFELKRATVKDLQHKHSFIQCGKCGAVVALVEGQYLSMLLLEIKNLVLQR